MKLQNLRKKFIKENEEFKKLDEKRRIVYNKINGLLGKKDKRGWDNYTTAKKISNIIMDIL